MLLLSIVLFEFSTLGIFVDGTADNPMETSELLLARNLLKRCEVHTLRPVLNQSMPLDVDFGFRLRRIVSFRWTNEYLTWNPADYAGVQVVDLPLQEQWYLDLTLYSSVGQSYVEMDHKITRVEWNGRVSLYARAKFTSSCLLQILYFPFENQYCRLVFGSWLYDSTEVRLNNNIMEKSMEGYFVNNGEWSLSEFQVEKHAQEWENFPNPFDEIHILLTFTRQSRYYVITVIVPSAALALVSGVVFFMSPQSEEKVALASSNLLAMLLFQELVSSAMPPIGDEFSLIGLFFVASILINSLSILTSLLTKTLFHMKDRPVPNGLLKLAFLGHSGCVPQSHRSSMWVVRRLSDLAGRTVSGAIHRSELKYRSKGLAIRAGNPILDGDKRYKDNIKRERCPTTVERQSCRENDEDFSRQWRMVSQRLNQVLAFALTSSYLLIVIIVVILYIIDRDREFPEST
ncbi:neuronal acetylcholine receptor subunit alpha-7-like [Diadema setosum]|uniref:neuronal acetylcholine receptor subunit alpha-7-like n=1 Tax=Diadema setosum TaxID=31175 RepID=UPI003B3ACFC7